MKVIALRGEPNCGKTEALRIVHNKMLDKGFTQVFNKYKDLGNTDFLDILEFNGNVIGIVSQGDYAHSAGEAVSVKRHLEMLKQEGVDIAICACSTGAAKEKIKKAIDDYQGQYIDKKKAESDYGKENHLFAELVVNQLLNLLAK